MLQFFSWLQTQIQAVDNLNSAITLLSCHSDFCWDAQGHPPPSNQGWTFTPSPVPFSTQAGSRLTVLWVPGFCTRTQGVTTPKALWRAGTTASGTTWVEKHLCRKV